MMNIMKKKIYYLAFLFLFLIYIFYNVPIGHDDWTWGSNIGMKRFQTIFANYNGRYLGGILTVLITRSNIIRIIIMAIFTLGIIILIPNLTLENFKEKKRINALLLVTSILLFLTPISIFSQTFSWISGFANYVPPILFMLIYLFNIKSTFDSKCVEKSGKIINIILFFVLGLCTQLFIEHMTLYMLALSVFIISYSYLKFKKIYTKDIAMFIGNIIGAIVMFSNGAYHKIAEGQDSIRSMPSGGVIEIIKSAIKQCICVINPKFFMEILLLIMILSILSMILVIKYLKNNNKITPILSIAITIISVYPIYLLYIKHYTNFLIVNEKINIIIQFIMSFLFYLSIIIIIIKTIESKKIINYLLFLFGSSIILITPLMFVNPVGGRNFLASYIFLVIFIVQLLDYLGINSKPKFINTLFISINLVVCIILACIFNSIHIDNEYRIKSIKSQLEQQKNPIYVPKIKHAEYLQVGNPSFFINYSAEFGFRAYYDIPRKTKVLLGTIKDENYLNTYLNSLIDKDYIVIISIKYKEDSNNVNHINENILDIITKLGLDSNVINGLNQNYIAIINSKDVLEEEVSDKKINKSLKINDINVNVINDKEQANIFIDGKDYSINKKGINIVVYDKKVNKVIDSVCFDIYGNGKAIRKK